MAISEETPAGPNSAAKLEMAKGPAGKGTGGAIHIDVRASGAASSSGSGEERACVIGAGKSGLIACKVLKERGIPFDCFEAASQVGGLWVLNSDSGRAAAYESLRINTSKQMTSFHDFRMPRSYPTFATREQIIEYLNAYVERFRFREHLIFRTEVISVLQLQGGQYLVSTKDLASGAVTQRQYASVLVANGHHWDPAWPQLPGSFSGELLHSHAYRSPRPLAGKRVLVIGAGNSGMDIASEAAQCGAAEVFLSCRRPVHVVPRHIFCVPSDAALPSWLGVTMGRRAQERLVTILIRVSRGRQRSFGFPEPDFGLLRVHPTISPGTGDILKLIKAGKVQPRPGISNIDGLTVQFVDGSSQDIDVIICATGYNVTCPFLPPGLEIMRGDKPELLLNVVHPAHARIFFLGFVQAHGPMIPCVEAQLPWVADLLQGKTELPSEEAMRAAIEAQHEFNRSNFTQVKRHALMVEFHRYLLQLRLARCPKGKGPLGRRLWRAKTFLSFCMGNKC